MKQIYKDVGVTVREEEASFWCDAHDGDSAGGCSVEVYGGKYGETTICDTCIVTIALKITGRG